MSAPKLIALNFPMDLGDLGEHLVNVYGQVDITQPEPSLGLPLAVEAAPDHLIVQLSDESVYKIHGSALRPSVQSNIVTNLEEFIREYIGGDND